jgi:hypothetical protein
MDRIGDGVRVWKSGFYALLILSIALAAYGAAATLLILFVAELLGDQDDWLRWLALSAPLWAPFAAGLAVRHGRFGHTQRKQAR